ncbi:putative serine/threonine-protein kinase 16 isoform X2 [Apostichopus japonicus]|uniref:non-specific serine/threonine protein kinase n=1 Tax=Stichopus japonicus TaxID=307972 RepID=A0A2G8LS46_STIJA|nr:putative serine/threonine-protein kinase 16 isoform X2 [Apostichopus japonicus]
MGASCTREKITIDGRRFYVIKRLGEGGFSYVDQVEESSTGKKFALKRIQCHSIPEEKAAEEEAKFHQLFNSPNLISLEAWCKQTASGEDSEVLLILPYLKRGTLQDELDKLSTRSEHLSEERLWKLIRGICEGVHALHHTDPPVAHRFDIIWSTFVSFTVFHQHWCWNLMTTTHHHGLWIDVTRPRRVKGALAVALQDVAAEKCSMLFRAPELFHVDSHCTIDEKVDIWSLGCVFYNMAFLQSPFEPVYQRGDSLHLAVLGRNYKFPENSRYSAGLKELVDSMLTVEALERPNIDWVMDKLSTIDRDLQNQV